MEKDYHEYIKKNPHLIEKGLRVQESQYRLDTGPIDLLCRDSGNRPVGVELKYPSATTAVVRQIGGYKTDFKRKNRCRERQIHGGVPEYSQKGGKPSG